MRLKTTMLGATACFLIALAAGCVHSPARGYTPALGMKAADAASSLIGRPYRYRGESPAGFDCSGLVRYSYFVAGMDVPHGTKELRMATRVIDPSETRKGDLLFFMERGRRYSHVGIYLEDNLFIHAPATGGAVRVDSLLDPYWEKRRLETRRFP